MNGYRRGIRILPKSPTLSKSIYYIRVYDLDQSIEIEIDYILILLITFKFRKTACYFLPIMDPLKV